MRRPASRACTAAPIHYHYYYGYSSPRGLDALQQLLPYSPPTLSVLTLSPPVTCQTLRIQVIPYALIPGAHRPASSAYSLYTHPLNHR